MIPENSFLFKINSHFNITESIDEYKDNKYRYYHLILQNFPAHSTLIQNS